jgi:hypothetical protein
VPGLQALQLLSVRDDFMIFTFWLRGDCSRLDLAKRFVEDNCGGGGEVEAAFFGYLGDADDSVGVGVLDFGGDAGGFAAEDQPVACREFCLPEGAVAFGGEEPDWGAFLLGEIEEGFGIVVNGEAQARPIVHGAATEISVAEDEAEGADEVEFGSTGDAGAGDVAGVGGDLRLQERELEAMGLEVEGIRCCQRVFPGGRFG